jgi:UDP-2-acetamido-2-deoxy-ribo-hexuluronate aminotransferase
MESIQAAVVSTKLKHFDNEIDARNRVALMYTEKLKDIPIAIHYPMPLPRQEAFSYLKQDYKFPVFDILPEQVMSLSMHAFIKDEEIDFICNTIEEVLKD